MYNFQQSGGPSYGVASCMRQARRILEQNAKPHSTSWVTSLASFKPCSDIYHTTYPHRQFYHEDKSVLTLRFVLHIAYPSLGQEILEETVGGGIVTEYVQKDHGDSSLSLTHYCSQR
jgi:hypothetical protein